MTILLGSLLLVSGCTSSGIGVVGLIIGSGEIWGLNDVLALFRCGISGVGDLTASAR